MLRDYNSANNRANNYEEKSRLLRIENAKLRKIIVGLSFLVVSLGGALIWRL